MNDQKEIYRLWYEYLKRSNEYREFCEWMVIKSKDPTYSVPKKFKKRDDGSLYPIFLAYIHSNDIHSIDFEEWWKWKKEGLTQTLEMNEKDGVLDLADHIGNEMDYCIKNFIRYKKREPDINEFKQEFVKRLQRSQTSKYLIVFPFHKKELLLSGFKSKLKQYKAELKKTGIDKLLSKRSIFPQGRVDIDNLKKYLRVYDLRVSNIKWKDVMADDEIGETWRSINNENDRRVFQVYKTKAEKIIRNVERGIFPGDYQ